MGIININTIQSNISNEDVLQYTDTYVKEALSNLGQRVGAKGDSLSVDGFSIGHIIRNLNESNITYISSETTNKDYLIVKSIDNQLIVDYNGKLYQFKNFNVVEADVTDSFTTLEQVEDENSISIFESYKIINNGENGKFFVAKEYTTNSVLKRILALNINNENHVIEYVYAYTNGNDFYFATNEITNVYNTTVSLEQLYNEYFIQSTSVNEIISKINTFLDNALPTSTEAENTKLLTYWNNYLNSYINSVYNDAVFTNNYYEGLKQYLLFTIFSSYINADTKDIYSIYINNDFILRYFINDTTKSIYYSYDFNTRFITNVEQYKLSENNNKFKESDIIYVYTGEEGDNNKVTNNKLIVVYYNDALFNTNFVESVILDVNYTLPYIEDDYWYINGERTNILSVGKDAGQPNILIISYTYNTSDQNSTPTINGKVLHSSQVDLSSDENTIDIIENNLNTNRSFNFNYNKTNVGNTDENLYTFDINLPNIASLISISHKFEALLDNCLLWTVVDTSIGKRTGEISLAEDLNITQTSYITVFWTIENGDWKLILNPAFDANVDGVNTNNTALDLGSLNSTNEITRFILNTEYNPEKYFHSYVVFDKVNGLVKNEINERKEAFPLLTVSTSTTTDGGNIIAFEPYFSNNILVKNNIIENVGDNTEKFSTKSGKITQLNSGDYIPITTNTSIIPLFNFGEVLTYNQTVLNRLEVSTVDNTGNVYNSYIGCASNPNELSIGTYTTNKNLENSKTLTIEGQTINKHNRLNIELPLVATQNVITKAFGNIYYILLSGIVCKTLEDFLTTDQTLVSSTKYMGEFYKTVHVLNVSSYLRNKLQLSNIINNQDVFVKLQSYYTNDDAFSLIIYLRKESNSKFSIINANEIITPDNSTSQYKIETTPGTDYENDFNADDNIDYDVFIRDFIDYSY